MERPSAATALTVVSALLLSSASAHAQAVLETNSGGPPASGPAQAQPVGPAPPVAQSPPYAVAPGQYGGSPTWTLQPPLGIVRLHIVSDDPQVQLYRSGDVKVSGFAITPYGAGPLVTRTSVLVCRNPCGVVVDGRGGQEFYFEGRGVTPSDEFQLIDKQGDVTIRVDPGSYTQRVVGVVGLSLGIAVALVGTLGYFLALENRDRNGSDAQNPDPEAYDQAQREATVFGISALAGVGLGVGGIALMVGASTSYEFAE